MCINIHMLVLQRDKSGRKGFNKSEKAAEPDLHLHIKGSDRSGHTLGGHLNEARISGTCEIIIDQIQGTIDKASDPEVGLNLFYIPN